MGDFGSRHFYVCIAYEKKGKFLMLRRNRHYHCTRHRGRWMNIIHEKPDNMWPPVAACYILGLETGMAPLKLRYHGWIQQWYGPSTVDIITLFSVEDSAFHLDPENYYGRYEWVDKKQILGPKRRLLWRPDRVLLTKLQHPELKKKPLFFRYTIKRDGTLAHAFRFFPGDSHMEELTGAELEEWS